MGRVRTLKGKKLMCPKCKGTDCLSRNEYVFCNTSIRVNNEGKWGYTGGTDVVWDTQTYFPEMKDPEWHCSICFIDFNAPNVESLEKEE